MIDIEADLKEAMNQAMFTRPRSWLETLVAAWRRGWIIIPLSKHEFLVRDVLPDLDWGHPSGVEYERSEPTPTHRRFWAVRKDVSLYADHGPTA